MQDLGNTLSSLKAILWPLQELSLRCLIHSSLFMFLVCSFQITVGLGCFNTIIGEGATTKPGMFTPMFGKVKGQAEAELLELSKQISSLKVLSVRPGGVDPDLHPEIHPFIPKPAGFTTRVVLPMLRPLFRATWSSMVSPTRELGQVLVDLAMGDGRPLEGKGISGEGRTISNVAFRRLAGI